MTDDLPSPAEAAERAVEDALVAEGMLAGEEPLLPGENRTETHPEDVAHWVKVYTELLSFKDELLAATDGHMDGLAEAARNEAKLDKVLLANQRGRYQRRLEWWQSRLTPS